MPHGGDPDPDAVMRSLAARQHGVVARAQLLEAGVPAHVIDHRLAKGRIDAVHRGVYRVGPAPLPHERELAVLLACGASAVLSHRSAALLWKLVPGSPCDTPVDVSVPRGHRAPSEGMRVHRTSCLPADEITLVEGIPVTVPARTLLDLAGQGDLRDLEQAVAQVERAGLATRADLLQLATRHPHRRGMVAIRALLAAGAEPAFTRSEAETRFLMLVRKAQLPAPATNVALRGYEVDFLWRAEGLVVEIDGFAFHSSSAAFECDRRRDAVLAAAGLRVLRITWRQISQEPEALLVRLAQALVQGGHG
jgi:very-short-patch-repair endonuclease